MNSLRAAAIRSERLLFGEPRPAARNKVLLAREPGTPDACAIGRLRPITRPADWRLYEQERVGVEQAYGVPPERVTPIVNHMRRCAAGHRIGWHFFEVDRETVGAVGLFAYEHAGLPYGRLQDVDIFPRFRGQGHGNGLLAASLALARQRGATALIVGADEDDWPLQWYLRRGFFALATVPKATHAALSHDVPQGHDAPPVDITDPHRSTPA